MRDLLVMLIVLGSVPAIFMRPWIGIIVWCWLGFMNPHRMTWGFAYNFPFAMLIAAVTLLAMLFSKEEKKLPMSALTVVWLLWIAWMNVTTVFAIDFDHSFKEWDRTMKIQLFVVFTAMLINSKERLRWLLWITVASIGFFGVKGGLFAVATGGEYRVYGPPGGFFQDNNAMGLALVMVLPLMWYLRTEFNNKLYRMAYMGTIGLSALAVLATHSRGAFLSIGVIVGFLWLKSRNKFVLGIVLGVAIAVLLGMMPEQWWDRMLGIRDYQQDASAMGRINAWWFAFHLASDHPITGGGFRTFRPDLFLRYAPIPDDFHDAHSVYFEVLGEHGFVGIGIFLLLGLLALGSGGSIVRLCRHEPSLQWAADLARMCQVAVLGYAVGGAFLGLAYFDLYYHFIAILIIVRALAVRDLARLAAGVPAEPAGHDPPPQHHRPGDRFANAQTSRVDGQP